MAGARLIEHFREAPLAASMRGAARALADWLDAADEGTRAFHARLSEAHPTLDAFLGALFEGSPFLADLSKRDPARLVRLLDADPDAAFGAALSRLTEQEKADTDLFRAARLARQEVALLVALADIGGVWDVPEVTARLSAFAEAAIGLALRAALRREIARGTLLHLDPADPERGSGYFLLGMGKLGARELNYSSDIDLIAFYDTDIVRLQDPEEHQAVFVRVTQSIARFLSERTYDGCVFRVDLRLRPDPGTYPVAISTRLAMSYYESIGQNWERSAMIKARPVAGDLHAGAAFLAELAPFVWRKYLDYAAIADIHAMKRHIHAVKGHAAIKIDGHDLKLGRGGIREIEFFAQGQQLIGGGRNSSLRARETERALEALAAAGWIAREARDELVESYRHLRRLEHRLQMIADEQTHRLPEGAKVLATFARFAGYPSRQALAKALARTLQCVESHYVKLFEAAPGARGRARVLVFGGAGDDTGTRDALAQLGFRDGARAVETVRGWLSGRVSATRASAARERLAEILPRLMEALAATGEPDQGLATFDRVVERLPAGVQLFSLLRSNPNLLDLLAAIVGTAPRLADRLATRPRVLEGLVEEMHAGPKDPLADVDERLALHLAEARDLEDALDRARVFAQEQMFLIGVRLLSGVLTLEAAGPAFSHLADAVLRDLHARLANEHARRFGRTPANVSAIVALGKLGSEEMTATSDLDLLLLYDDPFDALSDGGKPLAATEYYTRLTQRLVAALSAPTAEGTLYAVDFRLRPSGNKGPLATSLKAFSDYQDKEAWTWEHMALTRARVVSAPPAFKKRIETALTRVLRRRRDAGKLTADLIEMRRLIAKEKPPADTWDIKLLPGGLIDLEFVAQWLILRHAHDHPSLLRRSTTGVIAAARTADLLAPAESEALLEAARLYQALTQTLRLAIDQPFDPRAAPRGLNALLTRAARLPDIGRVEAALAESCAAVRAIAARLWGVDPHG